MFLNGNESIYTVNGVIAPGISGPEPISAFCGKKGQA